MLDLDVTDVMKVNHGCLAVRRRYAASVKHGRLAGLAAEGDVARGCIAGRCEGKLLAVDAARDVDGVTGFCLGCGVLQGLEWLGLSSGICIVAAGGDVS